MAYQNIFYIYDVPVTCTGSGNHDWITADFKIEAAANESNTAYIVKVYARIDSSGRMNWTGDGDIRVTCNGQSASSQVTLAMYSSGTTEWDGPATFTFGAPGTISLNMNFDLDLTRTLGTNGGRGPTHNTDGGNLQHFYYKNYNITIGDGGLPPLITPPIISTLTNTNPFNTNTGVSSTPTTISIKWTESGTVTNRYYRVDGGSWISTSAANVTISNLTEGTSYKIEVKSSNSVGDSNILSTTIRTRYNAPRLTLSYSSKQLDTLTFKWTSDKPLASSQYKIGDGSWISSDTGTSGIITINRLTPNTKYTITFKGVSTSSYDALNSTNEPTASGITLDIARITSIGDCIFGNSITINIDKVVTNVTKLKISTIGNNLSPEFIIDVENGVNIFIPTQEQLDQMYRCFSNTNYIPLYFNLITVGQWEEWEDDEEQKALELTGIAKTAHIGINNISKRAQVLIGVNNIPKRAIVWIGDVNNKPRRCI